MHDETEWSSQEEAAKEAYQYFMRVDPGMRSMLGPIERDFDELTGREMRSRWAKVAMMRGSDRMIETRVYLDPVPHVRQEKGKDLQGWYSAKSDRFVKGSRERPCMTDAVLTQPYGGTCQVQCFFCYLNSGNKGYRGAGLVTVPLGYGEHVTRQLASMRTSAAGYFTSFHDPFNSLEPYYHNTQAGATAFTDAGLPIFFLSRLSYPGWAFDLLRRNSYSYMQKSINTHDEDDWRKLSPRAAPLAQHMEEIREAKRLGIYVSIQCNPIIPGVVEHEDVERTIEMLAEAGADHVIFKFVEANHPWAPSMVQKVIKRFGENRAAKFVELFTENSCGGQKTIQEDYRREGHERYRAKCQSLGLTSSLCYEYTKRSGEWRSMGPEFLTADQCHGHRVPMFQKRGDRFAEMEVCPPSGCLTCADKTGKPACGSDLLGEAKALRLADFRRDPWATQ
jgi:DNA repair photolyase